jgi:hypothetical protein
MNTFFTAIAAGVIMFLVALLILLTQPTWVDHINNSIALATTVLGFALAIFGAVKSGFAVMGDSNSVAQAVPAGAATAAGALLLVASRFTGV